jgi:hypothetical protein
MVVGRLYFDGMDFSDGDGVETEGKTVEPAYYAQTRR